MESDNYWRKNNRFFFKCLFELLMKLNFNTIRNEKLSLLYYAYINIIHDSLYIFQIIINGISFGKVQIISPKHQKKNLKLINHI
jgi:hypothetical protein